MVKDEDLAAADAKVTVLLLDVMFVQHMLMASSTSVRNYKERLRGVVMSWVAQHPRVNELHVLCDSPIHKMRAKEIESAKRKEQSEKDGVLSFSEEEQARGIFSPLASDEDHSRALESLHFHDLVLRKGKSPAWVYWARLTVTPRYYFQLKMLVMEEVRRMLSERCIVPEAKMYNLLVDVNEALARGSASERHHFCERTAHITWTQEEGGEPQVQVRLEEAPEVLYESDGIFALVLHEYFQRWLERPTDGEVVRMRTVDTDGMDTALAVGERWLTEVVERASAAGVAAPGFEIDATPAYTWRPERGAEMQVDETDGTPMLTPAENMKDRVKRRVFNVWAAVRGLNETETAANADAMYGALSMVVYGMLTGTDYVQGFPLIGPVGVFKTWEDLGHIVGDMAIFNPEPPAGASHYALRADALRKFISLMYMAALPKSTSARKRYDEMLAVYKTEWLETQKGEARAQEAARRRQALLAKIMPMQALREEQNHRIEEWQREKAQWSLQLGQLRAQFDIAVIAKAEVDADPTQAADGLKQREANALLDAAEKAINAHLKKEKKKAPPPLPTDDFIEANVRIIAFCLGYFAENFVPSDCGYTQESEVNIGFVINQATGRLAVTTGLRPLSAVAGDPAPAPDAKRRRVAEAVELS